MLNLRKRIKDLQEKTTSVEARELCKEITENFVNIPQEQIISSLAEKFKTISDADKHVAKFIQISEKMDAVNNLGVARSIATIKESQIFGYPALKYGISKIENSLINQQLPEYMVIDSLIECLRTFVWDSTIDETYKYLKAVRQGLDESITVSRNIYILSKSKGNFIYEGVLEKLEEHFINPTQSSRASLIEELKKFNFSSEIRSLSESLKRLQKTDGKIQILAENSKCNVSSIYSPLLLENDNEYFFIRGNFFKKNGDQITAVSEEAKNLPEGFKSLCRIVSSPNVFITENKVSFYVKRNRVDIMEGNEGVEVHFNGSKIPSKELAKHMVSAGLFRLEESQMAYDVQFMAESFTNIFNLDFAKIIESSMFPGSYAVIMKTGDNICVNKVNESMRSNEFFSNLNTLQARNLVLEFIGFDIKESLEEYLEQDEVKLNSLKEEQSKLISNISIIEAQLNKLETALNDPYLSQAPQIQEMKSILDKEIAKLKTDHRSITEKIKSFESRTTSDAGFEVGDEVKINETGEMATVTAINSSRDTVTLATSAGKSVEMGVKQISSLENEIARAEDRNALVKEESEESEDDKKKL